MKSGDRRVRRPGGRAARPGAEALEGRELLTITGLEMNAVPTTAINVPLTNDTLGLFVDDSASEHIVMIDWGDGNSPTQPDVTRAKLVESPNAEPPSSSTYLVEGTHTYTVSGDFTIKINVLGGAGQSLWGGTSVTTVADIGGLPVPPGVAGAGFTNVPIAALSYNRGFAGGEFSGYFHPDSFYTTIGWGDGTAANGNVQIGYGAANNPSLPGNTPYLYILGTHTYTEPGTYTVVINAIGGPGQSLWANTSITIANPTAQPTVVPIAATAGSALTGVTLAGLTAPAGDKLVAAVDWGDGTGPTFGTVVADATPAVSGGTAPAATTYVVEGTHTYTSPGRHKVVINVIEPDGKSLWASTTATVQRSLSPIAGTPVSGASGSALGGVTLASLSGPAAGSFTAAIAWGDGSSPSFGTVVAAPAPSAKVPATQIGYLVVGSHKYAAPGKYTALINVIGPDGESAWGTTTITIT